MEAIHIFGLFVVLNEWTQMDLMKNRFADAAGHAYP